MRKISVLGMTLAAMTAMSSARAATPGELRSAVYQSYAYERAGNLDQAISSLTPAATSSPNDYILTVRLGWLNYLHGNYNDAAGYYRKAKQIMPTSLEADQGLLNALMAQNRLDEAVGVARSITATDHYNYNGNLLLARLYRLQGKFDLAERVCDDMLAIQPLDVAFLTELGLDKQARNDGNAAAAVFTKVLLLDPQNVVAKGALPAAGR